MKQIKFLLILATILFSSCKKIHPTGEELGEEALLQIGLSVDGGVEIHPVKSSTKEMDPATVPPVDSMYVELYRLGLRGDKASEETWNRTYFGKYEEAKNKTFRVNAGNWKMVAFRGDSTACGFDKPFFYAQEEFQVNGGVDAEGNPNVTYVEAEAKVSNVRIAVNFDETVPGSYYDYFVRFSNLDESMSKYKQILRYKKGETRDAYMMPTDMLNIEFMAQYENGDQSSWKYVTLTTSPIAVKPNDFLTVNISVADPREGTLNVSIKTDNNIIKEDASVEILEMWAPQDPPQVVAAGFINDNHEVIEGDNTGNAATISVVARGGLKNFFFKISSDYLAGAGIDVPLDVVMDLANPSTVPSGYLERLRAAGLDWEENMKGSRKLTYLAMTEFFQKINARNPSLTVERNLAAFEIEIVDEVGKSTKKTLTAKAYPITQTLSIPEGSVWTSTIISPKVTISKGIGKLFRLQVSTDGTNWEDLTGISKLDNSVIDYGTLPVNPNTKYYFRSVYNNNPNLVSNVVQVTTEAELQVGNRGFEEYHTAIMRVYPTLGTAYDREWYLPYYSGESDTWWAVNSKKTMPEEHSISNNRFKNFPCTAYSTSAHSGEKSAMVYTVNVNWWNTNGTALGDNVPGEIWIGKADDGGNHIVDGHSFTSRPSSLKFWYKYQPMSGESFVVTFWIKDKDGNEIARVEKSIETVAAEWTEYVLPIVYSNTQAKAATIYMSFKSCGSGSVRTEYTMEIAGSQQTAHIGSVLRIDDIELIY